MERDGRDGWERTFFDDLYWSLFLRRDTADADAVAERLWAASGLPGTPCGRAVLDQCCGAGEVSAAFARAGADVLALDAAANLVAIARGLPERVDWRLLDAAGPVPARHGRPYDLAYNFNTGIGYGGADLARRFFLRVEEALAQGGPFLVETHNAANLLASHAERFEVTRVDPRDGREWRVARESALSFVPRGPHEIPRMRQEWTLAPADGRDPPVRRSTVLDVMTPAAMGSVARAAGFGEPVALDAATLGPVRDDSARVIMRFTRTGRPSRGSELSRRCRSAFEARGREPAVTDVGIVLTGADCLDVAARVEAALSALPPGNGTRSVALLLPRSFGVPLAMVGIRAAGLAFCPLDADAPDARLSGMLGRLRPAAVVTTLAGEARARSLLDVRAGSRPGIRIDVPGDDGLVVLPAPGPAPLRCEASHVVFTSGSTGRPKAVMLRETGLLAVIDAQVALLGDCGGAPGLWALNPAFDASLSDILCPILGGRALAVHRPVPTRIKDLAAALAAAGSADVPPSMLGMVDPAGTGLSACVFGGERADPAAAARWGATVRAIQAYGPTEASVCVAVARAGGRWPDGLLGRPLLGRTLWLRGTDGLVRRVDAAEPDAGVDDPDAFNATVLVPPVDGEVEGELLVGGLPLGMGYMDDPDAQARRFADVGGRRVHATGDVVRWSDRALRWVGRDDRQVKVNGRMVCPEEVEAAVGRLFPGAVACCLGDADGLVVAVENLPEGTDLGRAVADELGRAFRPRSVRPVGALPRGPNGKVDTAAVAALVGDARDAAR